MARIKKGYSIFDWLHVFSICSIFLYGQIKMIFLSSSCTPLMFASMCNHPHVVNELLCSGASLTLTNINGHSALALAVKHVSTK